MKKLGGGCPPPAPLSRAPMLLEMAFPKVKVKYLIISPIYEHRQNKVVINSHMESIINCHRSKGLTIRKCKNYQSKEYKKTIRKRKHLDRQTCWNGWWEVQKMCKLGDGRLTHWMPCENDWRQILIHRNKRAESAGKAPLPVLWKIAGEERARGSWNIWKY